MADDLLSVFPLMVDIGASDLHLTVGVPPVLRLHGHLWRLPELAESGPGDAAARTREFLAERPACGEKMTGEEISSLVDKLVSSRGDAEARYRERGSADISYSVPGVSRFRVNVFRQRGSAGVVARNLAARVPAIDDLFSHQGELADTIRKLARLSRGLVLVTGPTGSGKSTTMASMIDFVVGESARHVLTLENPIEYQIQHGKGLVNQREIGDDVDTFAEGLRAALREDPDVIVVGEMRDAETIGAALTAAETGHLVLSTLHTRTAVETVTRVVDVFAAEQQEQVRTQLAGSLQAVLSQQLLPRAGSPGMVVAIEVLLATHAVRSMIRERRLQEIPSVIQTGRDAGMVPMDRALADLVSAGLVSPVVARERAVDTNLFGSYVDGIPGGMGKGR